MPFVFIHRDRRHIDDTRLQGIVDALPQIVAHELHTPENPKGFLEPQEISIRVTETSPFDRNNEPLEILILANNVPQRVRNRDQRRRRIVEKIRSIDPNLHGSGFLILNLSPLSFQPL